MNYLKFTAYFYLAAALFLLYDGFTKINDPENSCLLSFFLAAVAIFLFFFRKHFAKKFSDQNKKP